MGALDPSDPLYDAFRRDDRYGTLGWEPQPILEYIRLFIAGLFLVPVKFIGCVYFVSLFYTICRCVLNLVDNMQDVESSRVSSLACYRVRPFNNFVLKSCTGNSRLKHAGCHRSFLKEVERCGSKNLAASVQGCAASALASHTRDGLCRTIPKACIQG